MQLALNRGNLKRFMESAKGYVLTPKGRAEYAAKVCNRDTFEFVNREQSRRNQHLKRGDKQREDSKQKIAAARTGTTLAEETKAKISQALCGHDVSDETRAKISASNRGKPKSPNRKRRCGWQHWHVRHASV